jgi:hypothetical protein
MAFRKQWRWVGVFGPRVMACAAWASVGAARVSWWAVLDRETGAFAERGRRTWRGVSVARDRAEVPGVLSLRWAPGRAIEAASMNAWTRKTPLQVTGTALGIPVACAGLLDESAGRHPRHTSWLWSAGAGVTRAGAPVMWNLVEGMHPGERTVWVEGEPHPVGPLAFDGLAGVGELRFAAEATRARREDLVLIASDYEQPFGTFTGSLPVAGELREGWGVMERHTARW